MKYLIVVVCLWSTLQISSQTTIAYEKPPVFDECKEQAISNLKECFQFTFNALVHTNFKVPQTVLDASYQGDIKVLFEVDKEGVFQLIYVDAVYDELKTETQRVFDNFPKVEPATFNGNPVFYQYTTTIKIPIVAPNSMQVSSSETNIQESLGREKSEDVFSNELDSISQSLLPYSGKEYTSELNIPFTHSYYARFDQSMNIVGANSHTAAKPFSFSEVSSYHDFNAEKEALTKEVSTWAGRKFWNEHLVTVQAKDYWFTIDPVFDLQIGKDTEADFGSTYNNTRGIFVQGGLGKRLNFSASVYESQGRFAQYFNDYAEQLKPFGPDPAIIPGRGIGKRFKTDSYDYPVAEAYLSYTPADFVNIQFGHGKNFIGDGYRSLFQSDVTSPYPFLKTNFKFWKVKYTSTWMWLKDVRDEVTVDGAFLTKYMANHYLSFNVSNRLNVGLFESVVWNNANDRGFDVNYLNPLIFLRAAEFETGQDAGNAILGASAKYKLNNSANVYGQLVIDEFSLTDIKAGDKSYKNKLGFQLGAKYYNAFNVEGLLLQAEFNQVRPYVYSHNSIVLNYAHNNQSMAHLWGGNFRELVLIGRYNYKRWFADAKVIFGTRGFNFDPNEDAFDYGGTVFSDEDNRPSDIGIEIGQGNKTSIFHTELQAGYILNPVTNLRLFTNISYRNFDPTAETLSVQKSNTLWFSLGLRTDLFNWYFDF